MDEIWHPVVVTWWTWVAPLSIQGAALILTVGLVDASLPRRAWPELRVALWLLALIKWVLPPWLASPLSIAAHLPEAFPTGLLGSVEVESVAERAPAVVMVWLVGVILLTSATGLRYRRLCRDLEKSSTQEAPLWFPSVYQAAAARLGLSRLPEARFSSGVESPFVFGVLYPRIFLPDDLREDQAEHVVLHELAHVKRRDLLLAAFLNLLQLIYWFHPLVWWARRRVASLLEQCCDRTVTRTLGGGAEDYRRTLLYFAARSLDPHPAGLSFLRPRSLLLARLRQLEHAGAERAGLRRWVTAVVVVAMLVFFLPMARTADRALAEVSELVERPPGCLQLRMEVFQRLAEERAASRAEAVLIPKQEEKK